MANPKDKKDEPSPFTLDPTSTSLSAMPSLTRLLNRKSLTIAKPSEPTTELPPTETGPASEFPATEDEKTTVLASISIALPDAVPEATVVLPSLGIQLPAADDEPSAPLEPSISRAPKGRRGATEPLLIWHPSRLKQGKDPLGLGLSILLEKGAESALFLAATPGASVPVFVAKSQAGDLSKTPIWTGLNWDPSIFPDIWNYFVKAGFVELAPPGTATNQMSARNVIRGAFGVSRSEWLLLVRAGPEKGCRGVLAVVATQSLIPVLKPALALIAEKTPTKKAA